MVKKGKNLSRPSHMLPCKTVSFQRIKSNLQWQRGNFASIPSSQDRGTQKNSLVKKDRETNTLPETNIATEKMDGLQDWVRDPKL